MEVAIIGLGNFGQHLAIRLFELGHEIIAMDVDPKAVSRVQDHVQQAIVADATDRAVLEDLGVGLAEAAIVAVGDHIGSSVLITLHLREMAVPRIVAKAISPEHEKILQKVGADRIVFPERDAALRLAGTLDHPDLLEFLPIGGEYHVAELAPPPSMVGKSLAALDLRRRFNINVIALREKGGHLTRVVVAPDYVLSQNDLMVVLGKPADLERLRKD